MQKRRPSAWTDVPLNSTDTYDASCYYRAKFNVPVTEWRPGVPAGDFWIYPEGTSTTSLLTFNNGGPQTFTIQASNKNFHNFNGVNGAPVLQLQKNCDLPVITTCAEGQYFCTAENICKPAGQACNALCTTGTTVKWVDLSNVYSATGVS